MKKVFIAIMAVGMTATGMAQITGTVVDKSVDKGVTSTINQAEQGEDKVNSFVDTKTGEVSSSINQDLDKLKEQGENVANDAVENVSNSATETANDLLDGAQDQATDAVESVTETAAMTVENAGEITQERADNATAKGEETSTKAAERIGAAETTVSGNQDKISAAKERVQTALDNKDITADEAAARFEKIRIAQEKLDGVKNQISEQQGKVDTLNGLLGK